MNIPKIIDVIFLEQGNLTRLSAGVLLIRSGEENESKKKKRSLSFGRGTKVRVGITQHTHIIYTPKILPVR